jgi:hypothetical protein
MPRARPCCAADGGGEAAVPRAAAAVGHGRQRGATEVQVRGQPFDLGPVSRDNVARFEVR